MKFTEEQYRGIVEAWDAKNSYSESTEVVIDMIINDFNESWKYDIGQALALGNETSREWAHEQFVEKEKRYVWTSEMKTGDVFMRLYKSKRGYIGSTLVIENGETGLYEKLTESEIKEWGYNPEMFDKEEVG